MNINRILGKVMKALQQDNSIAVTPEEMKTHQGFTTEYMEHLGFTKSDLKHMVSHGIAKQGYVRIKQGNAETTQTRWLLIGDDNGKL